MNKHRIKRNKKQKAQFACDEYGKYSASKEKCHQCGIVSYCKEAGDPAWIGKYPVKDIRTVETPCFDEVSEENEGQKRLYTQSDVYKIIHKLLEIKINKRHKTWQVFKLKMLHPSMTSRQMRIRFHITRAGISYDLAQFSKLFPCLRSLLNPRTKR